MVSKKIGSISIKRNKISKENINFFDDISKVVTNTDRPLIIFPKPPEWLRLKDLSLKKVLPEFMKN